jgi:AraC-like DNA-binding protein
MTAVLQEHLLGKGTVHGAVWRYSREHPKLPHFHGQLELLLVRRGLAVERVGRSIYRVHARQVIWHLPGIDHELLEASTDLDLRVVHVEPDVVTDATSALLGDSRHLCPSPAREEGNCFTGWVRVLSQWVAGRPVVELKEKDVDSILECCEPTSDQESGPIDLRPRLRTVLRGAWRATRADHNDLRASSLVELASCRLLEDPFLDRAAVCRELDVSAGYLSRRFRADLDTSFQEHRDRARVAHFIAHVGRNRRTGLDAALRSGFGSYSQLYRVFGRLVGMNPREYLTGGGRNRRALVPA